jgi:hypothetical protein
VDADASVGSLGSRGHFGEAVVPADEPVEGCGREVAEDRRGTAGLDRGEEAALDRQVGVPHRVNPAVKGVEATVEDADLHGVTAHSAPAQFPE